MTRGLSGAAAHGMDSHCSNLQGAAVHEMEPCWRSSWRTESHRRDPTVQKEKPQVRTDHNSHSLSPCTAGVGVRWKEGVGWKGVSKGFTSHYPDLILLIINSLHISKLSLFCL